MISVALAILLGGQGAAVPPAKLSREGYARCLKDLVRKSTEDKVEPTAFEAALAAACRDKEAAFKAAMVSQEVGLGIKRAEAEKGVLQEIQDYRAGAKEDFLAAASTPKS